MIYLTWLVLAEPPLVSCTKPRCGASRAAFFTLTPRSTANLRKENSGLRESGRQCTSPAGAQTVGHDNSTVTEIGFVSQILPSDALSP